MITSIIFMSTAAFQMSKRDNFCPPVKTGWFGFPFHICGIHSVYKCSMDIFCGENAKCCPNGCGTECVHGN